MRKKTSNRNYTVSGAAVLSKSRTGVRTQSTAKIRIMWVVITRNCEWMQSA